MNDPPQQPRWQFVLGLLLLVAAAVAAIATGVFLWRAFSDLEAGPAAAIVTAGATVLISVFSLIFSKSWERRREVELQHRERKLPIYEKFMSFWFRSILHEQLGQPPLTDREMAEFLSEFTQQLILWGSDPVVKEYARFRLHAISQPDEASAGDDASEATGSAETLFLLEQLLFAIRADLGHRNKDLDRGSLLALLINDLDDYLPSPS